MKSKVKLYDFEKPMAISGKKSKLIVFIYFNHKYHVHEI